MRKRILPLLTWLHKVAFTICLISLSICDLYAIDRFAGWEQREMGIIRLFEEQQFEKGNEMLKKWLLSTPETIDYPFDKLQSKIYGFYKTVSPDKKLCVFSWNQLLHFRIAYWGNVIHYQTPTGYKTLNCSLWKAGDMKAAEDIEELGCCTESIHQTIHHDGRTIYLTRNTVSTHSTEDFKLINPYVIENGKICPIKDICIESDGEAYDELFCECNLPRWRDKMGNIESYSDFFFYDDEKYEWLIPVTDIKNAPTDKYERYIYNGKNIIFKEVIEGKGLHPSLKGFESLEQLYDVGKYYVRVDLMPDSTFRYASWKKEKIANSTIDMGKQPDIIVKGGHLDKAEDYYVFPNGRYEYRVNFMPLNTYELKLAINGKVKYIWKKEDE